MMLDGLIGGEWWEAAYHFDGGRPFSELLGGSVDAGGSRRQGRFEGWSISSEGV